MDDLRSLLPLSQVPVSTVPQEGQAAPDFPHTLKGRGSLVIFLRHCGCPFSEVAFRALYDAAEEHGNKLSYYAVSHATEDETKDWIKSLGLAHAEKIKMVIDTDRRIYGAWGLGQTSLMHFLGYASLSNVWTLATQQGIKNRTTKGSRWQQSGQFAVDSNGKVVLAKAAETANEVADLAAVAAEMAK